MRRLIHACCWLLAAAGPLVAPAGAADPPVSREYEVKAVFLYNFAQFVEWPEEAFGGDPAAPVCIGVLGNNPFGAALRQAVRGESVRGRGIVVKEAKDPAQLRSCHIVFVGRAEKQPLRDILVAFEGTHALTVGETGGFAEAGGVFNFFIQGSKVKFEINTAAARARGVKINAQLLGIARLVGEK